MNELFRGMLVRFLAMLQQFQQLIRNHHALAKQCLGCFLVTFLHDLGDVCVMCRLTYSILNNIYAVF